MTRGQYIDPCAARITFQQYAEKWVTHALDPNTQAEPQQTGLRPAEGRQAPGRTAPRSGR